MTRRSWKCALSAFMAVIIGGHALAQEPQQVRIRSGDHGVFTRLVLTIPNGRDWQLGRFEDGYRFRVDGVARYDLDGVFERIPRTRITELRTAGADLDILVTCACHADAFEWQENRIVIDILDGPPVSQAFEVPLPSVAPARQAPPDDSPAPPAPRETGRASVFALPPVFQIRPDEQPRFGPLSEVLHEDPIPEVAPIFGTATAGAIARGLSLGLLTPAPRLEIATPDHVLPRLGFVQRVNPLTLRTPMDRTPKVYEEREIPVTCLPAEAFSFVDIAEPEAGDFNRQLAAARTELVDAVDAENPQAIRALARVLTGFGLGLEAEQVLARLTANARVTPEAQTLGALAALLRHWPEPPPDAAFLIAQMNCHDEGMLWGIIAGGDIPDRSRDILSQYSRLPRALRRVLAIHLARRLSLNDKVDLARQVLDLAAPVSAADQVAEALLRQALLTSDVSPSALPAQLAEVEGALDEGQKPVPEDIVDLITQAWRQELPLSKTISDYFGALEEQFSQNPDQIALRFAALRAALLAGDFASVRPALARFTGLGPVPLEAASSETAIYLAEHADDATFMTAAYSWFSAPLSPTAEARVAQRLQELGFGTATIADDPSPLLEPSQNVDAAPRDTSSARQPPSTLFEVRQLLDDVAISADAAARLVAAPLE